MSRSATARLFVAVDPPEHVCLQLVAWARGALWATGVGTRKGPGPRVLDPESLHATLSFLGNRLVGEMDALGAQLAACAGPAGELSVGAPLWLPTRHPRALAVELHDETGRLARLQAEVVTALEQVSGRQTGGGPRGESATKGRRPFHPHVTVARMGRGAAPRERALPPTPPLAFLPRELVLYRSWLSPEGAGYEAVASHPIG